MRPIKTTSGIEIKKFGQLVTSLSEEIINDLLDPINKSKIQLFDTVSSIEWKINKIIMRYFYGPYKEEDKILRDKFNSLILSSDWCTFSSKKKLVLHIVEDLNVLKGKEKDSYGKLLQKTMGYRNAFAHGSLSTDGRIVKLTYFEGRPIEKILDQEFFDIIEKDIEECYRKTTTIAESLEIIKK